MVDADELREQAMDAILTTVASEYLSPMALNELASACAIFATQFAAEVLKERVE